MRIGIDFSSSRRPGADNYCRNFLDQLATLKNDNTYVVYLSRDLEAEYTGRLPANIELKITRVTSQVLIRIIWQIFILPFYLRKHKVDAFFEPFDFGPIFSPCPMVLQACDPTGIMDLSGFSRRRRIRGMLQKRLVSMTTRKSKAVSYPSQYAASALGKRYSVEENRRHVVYHGVDRDWWGVPTSLETISDKYDLPDGDYVLFVSELYRQKHPELILNMLAAWTDNQEVSLLIAGGAPDLAYLDELEQLAEQLKIRNRIRFLGRITHGDLRPLYQHALAFVLPTTVETFGHPYAEAMASGSPLIAADTEIAREICGNAATFFPAGDVEGLVSAMRDLASRDPNDTESINAGKQIVQRYDWRKVVTDTLELLEHSVSGTSLSQTQRTPPNDE
jgi:glycosyltransferase involved in cell wall biosynthesis